MTTNAINYQNLQETKRHNLEMEKYNLGSLDVARQNVQLGYSQVGLGYSQLAETQRANEAKELELNRHNMATESNQAYATGMGFVGSLLNAVVKLV